MNVLAISSASTVDSQDGGGAVGLWSPEFIHGDSGLGGKAFGWQAHDNSSDGT